MLVHDDQLARRVGAITLLVLGAAIGFVVFLLDKIELGTPTRIRIYFTHSGGLREQAPIVVAGQAIGRIEAIQSVLHGGTNPLAGEVGTVALVAIDAGEAWKVPRTADIFVSSRGILSEKYLEVAPPRGEPGPAVSEGDELRAADPPSLDRVLARTWANMTIFKSFVDQVGPELDALQAELAVMRAQLAAIEGDLGSIGPLAAELRDVVDLATATYERSLGGAAGLDQARSLVTRARTTITQARVVIERLAPAARSLGAETARVQGHLAAHDPIARGAALLATLDTVLAKVEPLLATAEELRDRIRRGEGSLGRLMTDPEFPEDAKELGKILKRKPWRVIVKPRP